MRISFAGKKSWQFAAELEGEFNA
jgi:hypothetical protein